jgi:hypothetical protein
MLPPPLLPLPPRTAPMSDAVGEAELESSDVLSSSSPVIDGLFARS